MKAPRAIALIPDPEQALDLLIAILSPLGAQPNLSPHHDQACRALHNEI
jgi:hypothetical protein